LLVAEEPVVDLKSCAQLHFKWKADLRNLIRRHSVVDPLLIEQLGSDTFCKLGCWLETLNTDLDSNYRNLKNNHSEFHRLARKVLILCVDGDYVAADHLMNTEFEKISCRIIDGLIQAECLQPPSSLVDSDLYYFQVTKVPRK
jgi:hypothetical protein